MAWNDQHDSISNRGIVASCYNFNWQVPSDSYDKFLCLCLPPSFVRFDYAWLFALTVSVVTLALVFLLLCFWIISAFCIQVLYHLCHAHVLSPPVMWRVLSFTNGVSWKTEVFILVSNLSMINFMECAFCIMYFKIFVCPNYTWILFCLCFLLDVW